MASNASVAGVAAKQGPDLKAQPSSSTTSTFQTDALENGKLLAAGGIAGAVSKSFTAPLARLTILYQVGLNMQADALRMACKYGIYVSPRTSGMHMCGPLPQTMFRHSVSHSVT